MTTVTIYGNYYGLNITDPGVTELDIESGANISLFGVYVAGPQVTVVNAGRIIAQLGTIGVNFYGNGILRNDASGTISSQGYGAKAYGYIQVTNLGTIAATDATGAGVGVSIYLTGDVQVTNGNSGNFTALTQGAYGVKGGSGFVTNFGTIAGTYNSGVFLNDGGLVTNGSLTDSQATIRGAAGGVLSNNGVTVINFGTIAETAASAFFGVPSSGVSALVGGTVTNGAPTDPAALVEGYGGVMLQGAAGTVTNFGTILGQSVNYAAVALETGGAVTNGAVTDTAASIQGARGVDIQSAAATVTNFGAIVGVGTGAADFGVRLGAGGSLTSGAATHTGALIEGYSGVLILGGAGTVVNFGTIEGDGVAAGEAGLFLAAGGSVTNGGGGDRAALIEGAGGVGLGAAGTVMNFGTVVGANRYGVQLFAGGQLVNGSLNNAAALIEGHTGLILAGPATAVNFGAVTGTGDFGGAGASLAGGVSLTNGAAGHARATITGYVGVSATGTADTVTNFGAIAGTGGTAVAFSKSSDVLVVEAGAFSSARCWAAAERSIWTAGRERSPAIWPAGA